MSDQNEIAAAADLRRQAADLRDKGVLIDAAMLDDEAAELTRKTFHVAGGTEAEARREMKTAASLDDVVASFRAEFPYWWWRGGWCQVSAHASIAPDESISDALRAFDERFNRGFDVDLKHDWDAGWLYTVAEALEAAMKLARAACDAWKAHSGKDPRE